MKKIVAMLLVVLSLLAFVGIASAERGDIVTLNANLTATRKK